MSSNSSDWRWISVSSSALAEESLAMAASIAASSASMALISTNRPSSTSVIVASPFSSENCEKYPTLIPGSSVIVPVSGVTWPRISLRIVDFPEPFLPIMPTRSPDSSRKNASRRMFAFSNRTLTSFSRIRLISCCPLEGDCRLAAPGEVSGH